MRASDERPHAEAPGSNSRAPWFLNHEQTSRIALSRMTDGAPARCTRCSVEFHAGELMQDRKGKRNSKRSIRRPKDVPSIALGTSRAPLGFSVTRRRASYGIGKIRHVRCLHGSGSFPRALRAIAIVEAGTATPERILTLTLTLTLQHNGSCVTSCPGVKWWRESSTKSKEPYSRLRAAVISDVVGLSDAWRSKPIPLHVRRLVL